MDSINTNNGDNKQPIPKPRETECLNRIIDFLIENCGNKKTYVQRDFTSLADDSVKGYNKSTVSRYLKQIPPLVRKDGKMYLYNTEEVPPDDITSKSGKKTYSFELIPNWIAYLLDDVLDNKTSYFQTRTAELIDVEDAILGFLIGENKADVIRNEINAVLNDPQRVGAVVSSQFKVYTRGEYLLFQIVKEYCPDFEKFMICLHIKLRENIPKDIAAVKQRCNNRVGITSSSALDEAEITLPKLKRK